MVTQTFLTRRCHSDETQRFIHLMERTYSLLKETVRAFNNYKVATKDKQAAWLVSNCYAIERLQYVEELQEYIDVSIYGHCGDRRLKLP